MLFGLYGFFLLKTIKPRHRSKVYVQIVLQFTYTILNPGI